MCFHVCSCLGIYPGGLLIVDALEGYYYCSGLGSRVQTLRVGSTFFSLLLAKKNNRRNQLLRAPGSVVGRRNSVRVDEGRKDWCSLVAMKTKARVVEGRGEKGLLLRSDSGYFL